MALRHFNHPILWENGEIAREMLQGHGYSMDFAGPDAPTTWQAPGYPIELYLFEKAFGERPFTYLLISLVQCVAVSAMVYPVAWLACRWFGTRAAALSAWITAFMPLYAWYCSRIHQPADVMAIYPWLFAGWFYAAESRKSWVAIATGLVTGIGAMFSPTLLAVFGIISFVLLLRGVFTSHWQTARVVFLGGVCTLVAITPWTVRNYEVFGRFIPVKDSFAMEFWKGNNPNSTGTPMVEGGREAMGLPADVRQLYGKAGETQMMDMLGRKAVAYIESDKPAFVRRTLKKIFWLWTATPRALLRNIGESEALKYDWIHSAYWALFALGFIVTLCMGMLRKFEIILSFATAFFVYSMVYGLTVVGQARYRAEIEFLFITTFAAACVALYDVAFRKNRSPQS